jgi:hypothetical protein
VIKVGTGGISSGNVSFVLNGWLGGYSDQPDNATLIATFENSAGVALKFEGPTGKTVTAAQLGPVTVGKRHDVTGLFLRQEIGKVPAATEQIKVELIMLLKEGGDNDGMADNLSLVFSYK